MDVFSTWLRGLYVDQRQGPRILVHGISLRADMPYFQAAPFGIIRVQTSASSLLLTCISSTVCSATANSATFPSTLMPSCAINFNIDWPFLVLLIKVVGVARVTKCNLHNFWYSCCFRGMMCIFELWWQSLLL